MKICSIEDCDKPVQARGWCTPHYTKFRRYGDPLGTGALSPRGVPLLDRFVKMVNFTPTCWLWTGKIERNGYGRFAYREGAEIIQIGAHRFAYEQWVGPIPEGLTIDHVWPVCTNRHCVRALGHLEPVTPLEQNRRAWAHVTHCSNGHEYTAENTMYKLEGRQRVCRACGRERGRKHYRKTHGLPPLN